MSITYEEALSTLEAMFSEPWNRELLDAVLRHEKGHMENTCDRILNHGDQDPQILVDRLKAGGPEPQVAMDEELARQLAAGSSSSQRSANKKKKGRGTPTTLPDDFLRIPGYKRPARSANGAAAAGGGAIDDETLARMLQDELFSEELARNPDFAHLARGGGNSRGRSNARPPPAARRPGAGGAGLPQANPFEGTMEKLSAMGMGARQKLAMFARDFEHRMQNLGNPKGAQQKEHLEEHAGAAAERRGLLDDNGEDEDVIEFEMKKTM